ncbi:MAG: hypothetical protein Q9159_007614 [Coniocarpon cinnabarinum]
MQENYKLQKEAWVSNLSGGSITEINLVCAVAPAAILLWSSLQARQSFFTPLTPLSGLVDFLLNCGGILYATTLFSSSPVLLNLLLLGPAVVVLLSSASNNRKSNPARKHPKYQDAVESTGFIDPLPVKPFVTHYRGTMMVVTCVAILAVDFPVFPRRFAKAETWGTSLMDLGVGSFVFSNGLVAARPNLKQQLEGKAPSLWHRLKKATRHAFPLFVLGLIRLYSVKELEYAEHVTEYGVHWNFFFTSALMPVMMAICDSIFQVVPSYCTLAILLGVGYQILLDSTSLTSYILISPRTDLVSKNREGIFSSLGYVAIFLAGQGTGTYVLPRYSGSRNPARSILFQKLALWSAIWCALYVACTDHRLASLSVSRRLANIPYVLWIAAFNSCQVLCFYLIEEGCFTDLYDTRVKSEEAVKEKNNATSHVLKCFNRNGLAIFLLANLLTGLVNLTLPTIRMSDLSAMIVLIAYIGTVAGIAVLLDYLNLSIKL